MTNFDPTYVFEGDNVYAIHDNVVIASGRADQMEEVESDATNYLENLKKEKVQKQRQAATHIVTPNGVRGKILNRVSGVWGEEISVKLENGEHRSFTVTAGTKLDWVTENQKTASSSPIERLSSVLDADYATNRPTLLARKTELEKVAQEAADIIRSGVSHADELQLDNIRALADSEAQEVQQAIDAIDEGSIEPYAPPAPVAVEQADLGGGKGDWLEITLDQMADETDAQDLDKVLVEDPALLAQDLDTPALADQGVAREMALSHIVAKTAGYEGEDVENFRDQFLARFERERRRELASRQSTARKEAATAQSNVADSPDEALFT